MQLFAIATLAPALCLVLAVVFGGWWPWISVGYLTGLVLVIDRIAPQAADNAEPGSEFPAAEPLLLALGVMHVVILGLCLFAVAGSDTLSFGQKALIATAAGLFFGQI